MFNLIPVLFYNQNKEKRSLDSVTKEFMALLKTSMEKFEAAVTSLGAMTASDTDKKVEKDIQEFVLWCRYFITGVLVWSLESKRYGMAKCQLPDKSLSIVL